MASEKDLTQYAESLAPIYKEILAAFPRIEPTRKKGYGLAYQTLAADFEQARKKFKFGEIILACKALEEQGLVKTKNEIFVHPTPVGEKLITILTGNQAAELQVPELPPLPK
ncbi:MAG: hypothetical protein HYX68_18570 [Planctomycetes bacterium]|nr:hypothetical protein [Planctomycetota bacterium]